MKFLNQKIPVVLASPKHVGEMISMENEPPSWRKQALMMGIRYVPGFLRIVYEVSNWDRKPTKPYCREPCQYISHDLFFEKASRIPVSRENGCLRVNGDNNRVLKLCQIFRARNGDVTKMIRRSIKTMSFLKFSSISEFLNFRITSYYFLSLDLSTYSMQ